MNWRKKSLRDEIDWIATLVPLFGVLFLGLLFLRYSGSSSAVLEGVRVSRRPIQYLLCHVRSWCIPVVCM